MRSLLLVIMVLMGWNATAQQPDSVTTVAVKVKGVTCANDLNIISNKLADLEGVVSSQLVGKAKPTSTMEVTYNPNVVVIDSIYARIEDSPSCDHPDQRPYKVKR